VNGARTTTSGDRRGSNHKKAVDWQNVEPYVFEDRKGGDTTMAKKAAKKTAAKKTTKKTTKKASKK
jgi:hypothetical protein